MEPETDQQRHAGEDKRQRTQLDTGEERKWKLCFLCGGRDKPGKRTKAGPSMRPSQAVWESLGCVGTGLTVRPRVEAWLFQTGGLHRPSTNTLLQIAGRPPTQRPYVADEEPTAARREEPASLPALQEGNNHKINKATTFLDESFELQLDFCCLLIFYM